MHAARFLVSGRVQGVAFRAYTRQQALVLCLRGHAVNLRDGRVEVLAVGEADAIDRLGEWLRQGSPLARVDDVQRQEVSAGDLVAIEDGFRIG
ncbi:MAG: acylphosphatase [Lysobacter sp.]|nr:acylphosphatase [Lysobacter sp.]